MPSPRVTYAVQIRNPDHTHRYSKGVEFADRVEVIKIAVTSPPELDVRVVETTRRIIWTRKAGDSDG